MKTAKIGATDGEARPLVERAVRTVAIEADGLGALSRALEGEMAPPFIAALDLIGNAAGRVIVTGIGKSGHVGRKVAATLASTGTPAIFVHPSEASHGDLGMITGGDVILALSWSGESVELKDLIDYSRRFRVPLVALTSRPESALGRAADVVLAMPRVTEACPHGLAPTTSTTVQLALGDALALALLERRGFTVADFRAFHPGGRLGAQLSFVRDLMHTGDRLPLVGPDMAMNEAIVVMTEKSLGCVGVVDGSGGLVGIITDGDLRRRMYTDLREALAGDIMTRNPKCVPPDTLAAQALETMNSSKITSLFVVEAERPVGIIHLHDLLRAGVA